MASAIDGISTVSNINRAVSQLGNANKSSNAETLRLLETVSRKNDGAAQQAVATAVNSKSVATEVKGNAINIIV